MSQMTLGEILGRKGLEAELHVQLLEKQQSFLSIKELVQLSDIFEMRIDDFLNGVDLES